MLATHRKQQILALLKENGQVVAKDVSQTMGISEDTIRRDLREMAQEGLLQGVHGGALPASPAMADFAGRELLRYEGKTAIGGRIPEFYRSRPSEKHPAPLKRNRTLLHHVGEATILKIRMLTSGPLC